jgi:RHS repeat-associated protein
LPANYQPEGAIAADVFAGMSTTGQLATALGLEEDAIVSFSFSARSSTKDLNSSSKAWHIAPNHVLLTTGLGEDKGLGDTDLAGDGKPDSCYLTLELKVPPTVEPNDETTNSLVFTTRFRSSEQEENPWSNDYAQLVLPVSFVLHDVGQLTSRQGPTVTRAIDVKDKTTVEVTFGVSDLENGDNDSGLVMNSFYFSEFTATALTNPVPNDARMQIGTYAWKKDLITVPGTGLPLKFSVFYNSGERTLSGRMGRRWTHSYDWYLEKNSDATLAVIRSAVGALYFDKEEGVWVPKDDGVGYSLEDVEGGHLYTSDENKFYFFDADDRLTTVTDLNGNRILLDYDSDGRLTAVNDTRGNQCTFAYDGSGRVWEVNYADEVEVSFLYNIDDDLVSIIEPENRATVFAYDPPTGDLISVGVSDLSQAGSPDIKLVNYYDTEHRVVEQVDATGAVTTKTYVKNWLRITDPEGNVTNRAFNPEDQLVWEEDPTGARTSYGYDENGNRVQVRGPLGYETLKEYDEKGNIVMETDPLGTVSRTTYNDLSLPIERVVTPYDDPDNPLSITFAYDERGNLMSETDTLGRVTSFAYTDKGQLEEVVRFDGSKITMDYSETGDLVSKCFADGTCNTVTHDAMGRKVTESDHLGNTTILVYDSLGRVIEETDPLGNAVQYHYDVQDRMYRLSYPDGSYNSYTYTPAGKLETVADPMGSVSSRTYSANGLLAGKTDADGRSFNYSYDAAGHLVEVRDGSGGLISEAEYDAGGNRIAYWDAKGAEVFIEYDPLGRPVREMDPLGNVIEVVYDGLGRITSVVNGRGQETAYTYDAGSRLTAEHLPDGSEIRHFYDEMDRPVVTAGPVDDLIERSYDIMGRLTARKDALGHTVAYRYDTVGNLTGVVYPEGHVVSYGYDAAGRMTSVTDWAGRVTRYSYDAMGRPVFTDLPDGSRVSRVFDLAGRMARLTDKGPSGETIFNAGYTYDGSGRIQTVNNDIKPLPDPVTTSVITAEYNSADQIIQRQEKLFSHDPDGNLVYGPVGGVPMTLAYDSRNRLVSAGLDRYRYDADGLRIEARVHGVTRRYVQDTVLDMSRVLEERDDGDDVTARYVWGLGLLYRTVKGDIAVYHYNTQGSTVALTDRKGQITDRYSYDEYGKLIAHVGDSTNPFTFNGYNGVVADDNGLYFHRARYYEPGLRIFLSRDIMAGSLMDPGSLNRYAYGGGDPVNNIDPDGEFFFALIIGLVVGAAVGFTVDVLVQGFTKGWDNIDWGQAGFAALEGAITGMILGGAAGALAKASWYTVMAVESSVAMAANAGVQGIAYAAGFSEGFDWLEFGVTGGLAVGLVGGKAAAKGAYRGIKSIGKKWAKKTTKQISRKVLRGSGKLAKSTFDNYDRVLKELGANQRLLQAAATPARESLSRTILVRFGEDFAAESAAGLTSLVLYFGGVTQE